MTPSPPDSTPPSLPSAPAASRSMFASRSLGWLIAVDALWTLPDVTAMLAAPLLAPLCFVVTAVPVWRMQRREGDAQARALAKAALCGVLAALPFPVCGTVFGATMLAFARRQPGG